MAAEVPHIDESVFGAGREIFAERSVKITRNGVQANRVLYGVRRADAPGLRGTVMALARRLCLPATALDEIELRFGDAVMVHAGQEGAGADAVYKLYLEFPRPPADAPGLRFVAWKVQRGAVQRSTYTRVAVEDGRAFAALDPILARTLEAVVQLAGPRLALDKMILLRVEEAGTPRVSLDLNVYDAGLTLEMAWPALAEAFAFLGHDTLAGFGPDARLGHLSVGTGRDGGPFLTVYADAILKRAVA